MNCPDGYTEIDIESDYQLKEDDLVYSSCCGMKNIKERWIGLDRNYFRQSEDCMDVRFFSKSGIKPRFATEKPYPYGY